MKTNKVLKAATNYTSMQYEMKAVMDAVMAGTADRVSARTYFYGAGKLVSVINSQRQYLSSCGDAPTIPFAQ